MTYNDRGWCAEIVATPLSGCEKRHRNERSDSPVFRSLEGA
ncbi:hypothetical protein J27TS7_03520 [Paenibacillus dendritiformis]|nr:hypothetical protein J27TS7_03520 [Paenibacillus dendritiformis]